MGRTDEKASFSGWKPVHYPFENLFHVSRTELLNSHLKGRAILQLWARRDEELPGVVRLAADVLGERYDAGESRHALALGKASGGRS